MRIRGTSHPRRAEPPQPVRRRRLSGADFAPCTGTTTWTTWRGCLRRTERRRIVVVDAVFSMEGTVADRTIAELADRHGYRVYNGRVPALDVLGPGAGGASAALGVLARMDVVMGVQPNPLPPSAGSSPRIGPSWTTSGTTVPGHVFPPACRRPPRLPPAALRVSRRTRPAGSGCWRGQYMATGGRAIRPKYPGTRSCR